MGAGADPLVVVVRTPGRWHVWSNPANCHDDSKTWSYAFEARQDGRTFEEHEDNAAIMQLSPQMLDLLRDVYLAGGGREFRPRIRRILDKLGEEL